MNHKIKNKTGKTTHTSLKSDPKDLTAKPLEVTILGVFKGSRGRRMRRPSTLDRETLQRRDGGQDERPRGTTVRLVGKGEIELLRERKTPTVRVNKVNKEVLV